MYLNYYNNKRFVLIFLSLFILITCKKDEDSLAFVNASSSNDDFSSGLYIIKVYQGINYTTHKLIIP